MKCDYCGKGRPKLWNKDGKFCDKECYRKWVHERPRQIFPYDFLVPKSVLNSPRFVEENQTK